MEGASTRPLPHRLSTHPVRIPAGLERWRSYPGGAAWIERLPRLAAECAEAWELTLGAPFEPAGISLVLPAACADGREAVLKLNFPEALSQHEAAAIAEWNGLGAVRLYEHDRERSALLVERCRPGTSLWELPDEDEANRVAADVLRRLRRPVELSGPFRSLASEAARWAGELPSRFKGLGAPFERRLLEGALAALRELGASQAELVVCHQDLHGGNILRAVREPWLAIDPKPLAGEPAFDTASLLRDRRRDLLSDPAAQRRMRRRLDLLAAETGLDRERMRGWAVGHALAWGVERHRVDEEMVACARLLAAA